MSEPTDHLATCPSCKRCREWCGCEAEEDVPCCALPPSLRGKTSVVLNEEQSKRLLAMFPEAIRRSKPDE